MALLSVSMYPFYPFSVFFHVWMWTYRNLRVSRCTWGSHMIQPKWNHTSMCSFATCIFHSIVHLRDHFIEVFTELHFPSSCPHTPPGMNTSVAIGLTVSTRPDSRGLNKAGGMVFMWERWWSRGGQLGFTISSRGPGCSCLVAPVAPMLCGTGLGRSVCLTLCDPIDCSLPGSTVSEILQVRILEWVAMPSSRRSSQPRNQSQVSCITGGPYM